MKIYFWTVVDIFYTNMKSLNFAGLKIISEKTDYSQTAYGGGCGLSGGLVMIK